jgi:hypothetical protein
MSHPDGGVEEDLTRDPTGMYFPAPPGDPEALEAKHRVADLLRALAENCTTVDAGSSGAVPLDEVAGVLTEALRTLEALPRLDVNGRDREAALAERGPFVGASNPLAAPLHLRLDGDRTRGSAVYGHAYEGGVGDMHGGAVLAAFDDLLGCAQMAGPVIGRTGTLTVRFRSPSPVGARIDYVAALDRVEGRKSFCSGQAYSGKVLLAEAEAVFVAPAGRVPRH